MKKLLSIVAISIATSLCITSCTEEDIKPINESVNAGRVLDPA